MLAEPRCSARGCRHFAGAVPAGPGEDDVRLVCAAFPGGIPREIAYGDDLHLAPRPSQGNDVRYEPGLGPGLAPLPEEGS